MPQFGPNARDLRIGLRRFEVRGRRRAAAGTVFLKSEYREFRHAEKG